MRILFVRPNKDAWGYKPVGLSLLMALEKRRGNEVALFDCTRYDFGEVDSNTWGTATGTFRPSGLPTWKYEDSSEEDLAREIRAFGPDEVWFSVLTSQADVAARLTAVALDCGTKVLWGGIHPTVSPEDCPPGVEIHRGEAIKSRYGIERLDDLPYLSWDEYEPRQFKRAYMGKVYRFGDHCLNWGCPYHCAYCINAHISKKITRYGTERIIAELKYLKDRHRIEAWKFHDENFLARPVENLEEIVRAYADEIGSPFVTEANPRDITPEKAQLLKDMGCKSVSLGLETGNPELRANLLNRPDTIEDVVAAFRALNKVGIRTSSFNLLGIPHETWDTYNDTVELNKRAEVQSPYLHIFYPFPGTPLRELAIKEGFFDPATAPAYRRDRSCMTFPNLTTGDLTEMLDTFGERVRHAAL